MERADFSMTVYPVFFSTLRFMLRKSSVLTLLTLGASQPIYAEHPPVDEKFVAYGGPDFSIGVEMIGTIAGIDHNELYLAPDPNYRHLLLPGNRIIPAPGEEGRNFWENFVAPYTEVIKIEAYTGVGPRPASDTSGTTPSVFDADGGGWRTLRRGDRVCIRGLHVVDYSHTMYAPLQTDSFCYGLGFLDLERACYAHGEIHPYNYTGIVLDRPQATACLGPNCAETRTLMVVAPFIPQIFSWTHEWNRILGIAGDFLDEGRRAFDIQTLTIPAPPMPSCRAGCILRYRVIDRVAIGSTQSDHSVGSDNVRVLLHVYGTSARDTALLRETVQVYWEDLADCVPRTTCGSDCGPVDNGCGGLLYCPDCPECPCGGVWPQCASCSCAPDCGVWPNCISCDACPPYCTIGG